MSRYIDADRIVFWVRYVSSNCLESDVRKIAFSDEIARIPTADVVEVRHGEWDYIATHDCFSCNLCKFDSDVAMKYCGGCGAKMDGERSENGT